MLQSGGLKSHAALVTARVHEHHAAKVAIVPAMAATSGRVLPEQVPRSLHSPIVSAAVEAAAPTTSRKRKKKKAWASPFCLHKSHQCLSLT